MDHSNSDELKDPSGEPGDVTHTQKSNDQENPESLCSEKEQRRCNPCTVAEDLSSNGSWSQRSISRSLQRAETLLRSTFNPSLRWLFHGRSQDEEEVEGNFVVAHNLVSRSSARLLRLQQVLLSVAPQWRLIGSTQVGSGQVCVKSLPAEGGVLLQEHYAALWRLLEQRSLLLFMHEYSRRAHLAAAFISRVSHLLEDQLRPQRTLQTPSSWTPPRVGLCSLSQELRVHLNHWSCLFSKVQSDHYLRPALVQQTQLLKEIKQTLDLLGLEALVLMERYVCVLLSSVAQTDLDSVPKEALKDILAGADLYNQAVGEQRAHQSATQLRTSVLQQAHYSTLDSGLPTSRGRHPGGLSVKELVMILAVHQADVAAKQLQCWASEQSHHICQVHPDSAHGGTSAWRPEWSWQQLQHTYLMSSHHTSAAIENHRPVLAKPPSAPSQTSQCQTYLPQTTVEALHSFQPTLDRHKLLQKGPPPSPTVHPLSALPVSGVRQWDRSSIELLFQVLASHTPAPEIPNTTGEVSPDGKSTDTDDSVGWTDMSRELNKAQHVEGAEVETPTRLEAPDSSGFGGDGNPVKEEAGGAEETIEEPDAVRWPHSVQWLDLGQSLVFADVFGQYRSLLWTSCSRALWLQLHVPQTGNTAGSISLQDERRAFQILHRISGASKTDLVPEEGRTMLEDLSVNLFVTTAHAQWDHVMCRSLGSALKDKCLPAESDAGSSVTMETFLLLSPPLLSSLCRTSASLSLFPSRLTLQRQTVSLALATVQMSTVWVMSKAYQFLSSWNLNKFLLITQGDLKALREALETMVHQTKSLVMNSDDHQHLRIHNQLLLRQQLRALDSAVSELQTFSSLVLKTFSRDCKRMSGEIFEQTMPPAVHWRPSVKTGFPSSPSEYASRAAQTVIGQVLEGVAPLSDDARVQALSITMTAFMEAWMEHILRQKIKFSVQGALQLKQDFDSIRELIQSDRFNLSADLHQHLLGLRVFQQVDSAVMCLLQQPQVKPYLQPRAWEPFTHCCPASSSRGSADAAVGSSITNLRSMEGEDLTDPSVTTDLPAVTPPSPGEPYLAPSLALGVAQQEWLDLRIHSSARRWRLPGLQCLSKSEP